MPSMITTPVGQTPLHFHYYYNPNHSLNYTNSAEFVNNLTSYLEKGYDLAHSNLRISYSFVAGPGISTSMPGYENIVTFDAKATLGHLVAEQLTLYELSGSFLSEYNVDFNSYFEFHGSYNQFVPLDGTPLHLATLYSSNDPMVVQSLIELGAHPNIKNSLGVTPKDIAQETEQALVADYLEEYIEAHPEFANPITFDQYLVLAQEPKPLDHETMDLAPSFNEQASEAAASEPLMPQDIMQDTIDELPLPESSAPEQITPPHEASLYESVMNYLFPATNVELEPHAPAADIL